MKLWKKIAAILLAGVLCFGLFGCGDVPYMNDPVGDDADTTQDPVDDPTHQDPTGPNGNDKDEDKEKDDEEKDPSPTDPDPDDKDSDEETDPDVPDMPDIPDVPDIPDEGEGGEGGDEEGGEGGDVEKDPEGPSEPDPSEPDDKPDADAEKQKYAYLPQIFDEMPKISIDTADRSNDFITKPNRNDKLAGNIEYVAATIDAEGVDQTLSQVPAQVKARGNYTLDFEKKPIRIKFDKKQNLFGLNEGQAYKSWVLLAEYKDLSALNNATAFYLGQTILGSDGYYCSDFCPVEVYINGEYWGVYLLVEQQEAKLGRAGAVEADDGETGTDIGYLMEYDGYYDVEATTPGGDPTFTIDYGGALVRQNGSTYTPWQPGFTIKSDIASDAQRIFLQSYMQNAFRILRAAAYEDRPLRFNDDFTAVEEADCTPREAIEAVIDLPSLVDTYILQEITCDPDIAWSSFYLSLDMREGGKRKLVFEAPWDYDSAFGIKWDTVNNAYGLYAANCDNPWFTVLIRCDFFQALVREKWEKLLRYDVLTTSLSLIAEQTEAYKVQYGDNLARWPNRLYGNDELTYEMNQIKTQGEAAEHLSTWLTARLNYLNSVFGDGKDILTGEPWRSAAGPLPDSPQHRFEAENCIYTAPTQRDEFFQGASGGVFLGQIQQGYDHNRFITLVIDSPEETDAYLSVGLSKRSFATDFGGMFALFVNDEKVWLPPCPIEACANGEEEWGAWTSVGLGSIHLKRGTNTITLNMISSVGTNVDYFDLYCDAALTMISNL